MHDDPFLGPFIIGPTSSHSILAGIKTAAVINVGTATIGAVIGGGGSGQPILTGLRRDDRAMILLERRDPRGPAPRWPYRRH